MAYSIPVPNGDYQVNLHFSEITHNATGERVFDVLLEGSTAMEDIDIYALKGKRRLLLLTADVTVRDGALNLGFAAHVGNPQICAFEVIQLSAADPLLEAPSYSPTEAPTLRTELAPVGGAFPEIRVSASELRHSFDYIDTDGKAWATDRYFDTTSSGSSSSTSFLRQGHWGTKNDKLLHSQQFGPDMAYSVPVPDGEYQVKLHFSEITHNATGQRVFDVLLEGSTVIEGLDIYALKGERRLLLLTETVTVSDGVLNLGFAAIVGNPQICAFEIIQVWAPIRVSAGELDDGYPCPGGSEACGGRLSCRVSPRSPPFRQGSPGEDRL